MKTRAIRLRALGGPENLHWEEVEIPPPGPGEVLLRHTAVGLNYIDTYHRTGLYPVGEGLPVILGKEAVGVVEEVDVAVKSVAPGDRVAYLGPLGAYSERRVIGAEHLVPLPPGVSDESAAATLLKGLTAHLLLSRFGPVDAGSTILIHAAAGGVGLILCQWAQVLGARVIGTVGSEEKARLAAAHGCDHTILYRQESFPQRVLELTDGEGVAVVFDGVGKATFDGSLESLAPFGRLIAFGNASGAVPPVDVLRLTPKCLTLARPSVATGIRTPQDLLTASRVLFRQLLSGAVRPLIGQRFPLKEAAKAHETLEARETFGATILLPQSSEPRSPEPRPGSARVQQELTDSPLGLPVGIPVAVTVPMEKPSRAPLVGRWASLLPLDPQAHGKDLFEASNGDAQREAIWAYMLSGPFADQEEMFQWLMERSQTDDPLFFAVCRGEPQRAVGMAAFHRIELRHRCLELGHIWYSPTEQRTRTNTETIYLMLHHSFETLGARRVEWKCHSLNTRSRAAALRLGFRYEGTFRQHVIAKGRNRDTAWFAMLDHEWPGIKENLERWLYSGEALSLTALSLTALQRGKRAP
ncbi:MAG: GNAT family N-acetyltransferase [Deltaproteobacteria bacterium]|nr:GNAT family N-acetyltransferase [Deltaproteobacteria bacterium]